MTAKNWAEWPVLAFDTETSGVDVYTDRIVQLALVDVRPGQRPTGTTMLVDPGVDIPDEAAAVHGINRDHAATHATHPSPGDMLFEAAARIAPWIGKGFPLVGMNLAFDLTLFEVECVRHGVDGLIPRLGTASRVAPVVDVMVLDKYVDAYRRGGRKLTDLCAVYGVRHTGAHDATADALACARIWPRLMAKHAKKFQAMTMGALHLSQVKWRRDQTLSFQAYAAKHPEKYAGFSFDTGWPFHSELSQRLAGVERVGVAS